MLESLFARVAGLEDCNFINKRLQYQCFIMNVAEFFRTPTTMVIIFGNFLMFDQIFYSPQVKRSVIISNKHGMHVLPYKLPNSLRLRILRNLGSILRNLGNIELQPSGQPPPTRTPRQQRQKTPGKQKLNPPPPHGEPPHTKSGPPQKPSPRLHDRTPKSISPPPPFPPHPGDTPGANAHLILSLISPPPPPNNFTPRPIAHPLDLEIGHALYYGSLFPVIKHMHE